MIDTDPLLSVVMPVYNERTTIDAIVRRVLAVPIRIELIVVGDGSNGKKITWAAGFVALWVLLKYRFVE
jgi:glycosyltransferase involved in cell wall biosynthesis